MLETSSPLERTNESATGNRETALQLQWRRIPPLSTGLRRKRMMGVKENQSLKKPKRNEGTGPEIEGTPSVAKSERDESAL